MTEKETANRYIDKEIMKTMVTLQNMQTAKKKIQGIDINQYYEISLDSPSFNKSGRIENYIVKTKAIGGERCCQFKIIAAEYKRDTEALTNFNVIADGLLSLHWTYPWTYKPWTPDNVLLYISWEYKSNEFIDWLQNPEFQRR